MPFPTIKLSPEQEQVLRDLEEDIEVAKRELERAKSIGIDVSDLERKLEEAIKMRDELLRLYGSGV